MLYGSGYGILQRLWSVVAGLDAARESGLASTCCAPLSVSNPLVRRFQSLSMSTVPECWHGDECPWHKRGRCLFKHCALPAVGLTGGEVLVEQQLRDLRRALQRLAAAVMWRDGVPMPQVVKGTLDATLPHIVEELQERISERMHGQVVDVSVPMTVHQPGDQARRVPADLSHRQSCRYACGDAVTGPSDSDCIEDSGKPDQPGDQACRVPTDSKHRQGCSRSAFGDATTGPSNSDGVEDRGRPADAVRWQSYGGADGMRQVACPKCGCLTTCVEDDACDECGEYSHIRECASCIWYACTRCMEAAQAAKLPWEARRRRGRGCHWW